MATSTTTPAPTLEATIEKDIAWLHTHLVIVLASLLLTGIVVVGGFYEANNLMEEHDAREAAIQKNQLDQITAEKNALLNQLNQDQQANAVRDAKFQATIDSLVKQKAQEDQQTQQQVQKDATLDASQAAARLGQQTKAAPNDITVQGDNVTLSLPITRKITEDEDNFAQAQKDEVNLQGQLTAQQSLTADAKQNFSDAQKVIAEDKTQLVAQIKTDNDECAVKVDKARKHGFWFSAASFVAGVVFGHRF